MATEQWAGLDGRSPGQAWRHSWVRLDELELSACALLSAQACGWPAADAPPGPLKPGPLKPGPLNPAGAEPSPAAFLRLTFSHVSLADEQGRELAGAGPLTWTLALAEEGGSAALTRWWGRLQAQWQPATPQPPAGQRRHLCHLQEAGPWQHTPGELCLSAKGEDELTLAVLAWRWDWPEGSRLFPMCQC